MLKLIVFHQFKNYTEEKQTLNATLPFVHTQISYVSNKTAICTYFKVSFTDNCHFLLKILVTQVIFYKIQPVETYLF